MQHNRGPGWGFKAEMPPYVYQLKSGLFRNLQ